MDKQEQIKDWFIHQFWPSYPGKWCRNGKGSRQQALNSMLKHNPDEDERTRILGNLKAQVRADKGNQNRKWWCIGVTYVNNQMWEDTIEVEDEITTERKYCQCGEETIGPQYRTCPKCLETKEQKQVHLKRLAELGLHQPGLSLQELSQNCREYLRTSGAFGKALEGTISSEKPPENGSR